MLKTLWTVTAAGLLALCVTGCGGSDEASKICDKMKSCDSTLDVNSCKSQASQGLASVPDSQKDAVNKMLDQCIAGSCATLQSCVADVQTQVVDYYVTQICDKLKSCDSTTDVSQCKSQAGQNLALVPSSVKDDVNKMLDQCLAQTSCSVFQSCIGNVQSLVGG